MATIDEILGARKYDLKTGKPVDQGSSTAGWEAEEPRKYDLKTGKPVDVESRIEQQASLPSLSSKEERPISPVTRVGESIAKSVSAVNIPLTGGENGSEDRHDKNNKDNGNEQKSGGGATGGYEELYKKLNPYTPPTAEELEKEKKKQRRNEIFAAIGDGVMALSNLYFTTQGAPNMYTGKNTMSERTKARYDKLIKDREEKNTVYFNGLMKARQADEAAADRERTWQRQLGLDQEARDRYNESITHRNERERISDERYNREQEYKESRDQAADKRWQKTFDEDKHRSDRSYNFQVQQHDDNVAVRREQVRATAARGVRGKQLGFADGNGNQVSIYENVWKGSMQQVYDVLYADMVDAHNKDKKNNPRVPRHKTQSEKEDFVKQNWHKSPRASQIMLALSGIDPATMTSEVNDEDGGLGWGNNSNKKNDNETDW